ncbi:odorant receptor 131-2-like [Brachyhypopomus gauderio]|uniref:odorant receptor 131-2-like n=1 Tax=Brachyhypopomus gauderio TaxID=698409 RepID=UPI0040411685
MAIINETTAEVLFIHQQIFLVALNEGPVTKLIFAILTSLLFVYLNGVMLCALWSKPFLKETPRYILFAHMLLNDSIQLVFTSMLYIFSLCMYRLATVACAFIVFVSGTTFRNTPLNLAVMSMERYMAICFPLRHTEFVTQKRTFLAIAFVWFTASCNFIVDFLIAAILDPNFLTLHIFCTRERLFIKPWQADVLQGFNAFFFVSVTLIIVFTYISIMITARSVSTNKKDSARKAHRTVLLHLIQLGLCLITFLYSIIERAAAMAGSDTLFLDLRYLNYLFVLILPRCLSPLIYGLRDNAVRPLFIYRFCCHSKKFQTNVYAQ